MLSGLNLDKKEFKSMTGKFNWSVDFVTFKRNVIIALANSGNRSVIHQLKRYTDHESEVLCNISNWALKKLSFQNFQ